MGPFYKPVQCRNVAVLFHLTVLCTTYESSWHIISFLLWAKTLLTLEEWYKGAWLEEAPHLFTRHYCSVSYMLGIFVFPSRYTIRALDANTVDIIICHASGSVIPACYVKMVLCRFWFCVNKIKLILSSLFSCNIVGSPSKKGYWKCVCSCPHVYTVDRSLIRANVQRKCHSYCRNYITIQCITI